MMKININGITREMTAEELENFQNSSPPAKSYEEAVNDEIRKRYTVSQELAILRQRDEKPDEYAEYYAYCEACKAKFKALKENLEWEICDVTTMFYRVNIEDGYIHSVVKDVNPENSNITEEEYNRIKAILENPPTTTLNGFYYRLKENLEWELCFDENYASKLAEANINN